MAGSLAELRRGCILFLLEHLTKPWG